MIQTEPTFEELLEEARKRPGIREVMKVYGWDGQSVEMEVTTSSQAGPMIGQKCPLCGKRQ